MFDQMIGYVKKFTEAGVALLAFGIVMQIIFGKLFRLWVEILLVISQLLLRRSVRRV